jgi:2-haloacid dehalogenase
VSISKHSGLPWDAVTAETAEVFKLGPAIYHTAAQYLGILSSDIMMVVTHNIRHLCL